MREEELKALLENAALSEEPHPEEKKESVPEETAPEEIKEEETPAAEPEAAPEEIVFQKVLDKFFNGEKDQKTLDLLGI